MMRGMKTALIVIVLALLACLLVLGWGPEKPEEPVGASSTQASPGPSFEVHVVFPRIHRPFFGILPEALEAPLDGIPHVLSFDHTSPGADIGSVRSDRLVLTADGWNLTIETDGEGRVAPETYLELPLAFSNTVWRLRCRPGSTRPDGLWRWPPRAAADPASGFLRTTTRAGGDELDGRFLFELAACESSESDKAVDWPSSPLTVRGSFAGVPYDGG